MKHTALSLVIFLFATIGSQAYGQKIGHVSTQEILLAMPEYKAAQSQLDSFIMRKRAFINSMIQKFQQKQDQYQQMVDQGGLDQSEKNILLDELQDMQENINNFQQSAQKDIEAKEQELSAPLLEKVQKAIEEVAIENNYSHVIDNSAGVLVYSKEGTNLNELVKKKLNIQ